MCPDLDFGDALRYLKEGKKVYIVCSFIVGIVSIVSYYRTHLAYDRPPQVRPSDDHIPHEQTSIRPPPDG